MGVSSRSYHAAVLVFAFIFCAAFLLHTVQGSEEHENLLYQREDFSGLPFIVEIHGVSFTIQDIPGEPNSPRHIHERIELLKRLDRSHGTWSNSHPRHRLLDALHGFLKYEERQKKEIERLRGLYKNVSKKQKNILKRTIQYTNKLSRAEHIIERNQDLCKQIVENAMEFYQVGQEELNQHIHQVEASGKLAEKVSVSQALKHIVRDWTDTGAVERNAAFPCITQTLSSLFPDRNSASQTRKVLLPGAGLGRLGHTIAELGGFEVTNNEWSMYMNVMYRFLQTHRQPNSEYVHPFVDSWSHQATTANMFRKLSFPDAAVNTSDVVLVEGDFTTILREKPDEFDSVITHFFIDTARNLMAYFDTIHSILAPGGYWINYGPLLYGSAPFVQLSLEEIATVVEEMGFEFLDTDEICGEISLPDKRIRELEAAYGFDDLALTKNAYKSQFWVVRKKE